jgi:hypothetical protein
VSKAVALGELLQLRARVGDGDEAPAGFLDADELRQAVEEVLLEDVRLERGARLAGHDEERVLEIDLVLERLHLRGVGGIEHVQLREVFDLSEGRLQDFRPRLDAPIPRTSAWEKLALRTMWARAVNRSMWASWSFVTPSQPSQCASSLPVHTDASRPQSRRAVP